MLLLLTCGAFCGMMIISQASSVAQNMVGMAPMAASTAVSVLAAFNFAAAGYFGPTIMRNIYAANGIYQPAFLVACGLNAAGVALCFVYRLMTPKK